jgi:hypothetical protein
MATLKNVSVAVTGLAMVAAVRPVQIVPAKPRFDLAALSASTLCPEVMAMLQNAPEELEAFGI